MDSGERKALSFSCHNLSYVFPCPGNHCISLTRYCKEHSIKNNSIGYVHGKNLYNLRFTSYFKILLFHAKLLQPCSFSSPGFSSELSRISYMNLHSKLKPGFSSAHFPNSTPFQLLGDHPTEHLERRVSEFYLPDSESAVSSMLWEY